MSKVIKDFDWKGAQNAATLLPDEQNIVKLIAEGKSTYKIAKILKTNRSAVWFKARDIRQKLESN
jgi:DNA-binding CsgD family transcriptional regulator